jgi:PAS domain S-box-containing protein
MNNAAQTVLISVQFQLLLTLFLAVLLWALYFRLHRLPFFRWWAWAWTSFAVYLATGTFSLRLGPQWTPAKSSLIFLLLVFGFLQPTLLVLGGMNWRRTKRPPRAGLWTFAFLTVLLSIACFVFSYLWRHDAMTSFAIRSLPRTLGLTAALLFCAFVFFRHWRRNRSWAALITGFFCLLYAFDQAFYSLAYASSLMAHFGWSYPASLYSLSDLQVLLSSRLFFLDLFDMCGICLGMIVVLVEEYQHKERQLEESRRRNLGLAADNVALQAQIAERERAEAALRESEAKFRQVAETASCGIWILQDGQVVYLSPQVEIMSGYSPAEIQAMDPWEIVHPDFRPTMRDRARMSPGSPKPLVNFQFRILTKQGEERWLELTDCPLQFQGKPAILVTALDITELKRAEQEIKEHAMYLDALISNSPLAIVIKDENQLVRFCNPAFERMFLYAQSETQGKDLDVLIAPHDLEAAVQLTGSARTRGVVHATAQRQRKDGTMIDVELYGVPLYSGSRFVGAFAFYQDITERRRSEEKLQLLRNRLVRAQEEERARIARDLHDDAGQRLALLNIDLERLKQSLLKTDPILAQQLDSLVKMASEIASDVHSVSRRLHPSQVELLGLVKALGNFCREFAARNDMEISFEHPEISSRHSPEAALCLFMVAQEAIRNVLKHSGCRHAQVELAETDGQLRLRVSDTGGGFDPAAAAASMGLGLLSMEERLLSMGGNLIVKSQPGGGTCIEACLPLQPVAQEHHAKASS